MGVTSSILVRSTICVSAKRPLFGAVLHFWLHLFLLWPAAGLHKIISVKIEQTALKTALLVYLEEKAGLLIGGDDHT